MERPYRRFGTVVALFVGAAVLSAATATATAAGAGCPTFTVDSGDRVTHPDVDEASGIVASRAMPGVYWIHNDGDPARSATRNNRIYAIDGGGNLLATVQFTMSNAGTVPGDGFVELEDIAIGWGPDRRRDYLYLGDIGDNSGTRDHVRIYRFPEPSFVPDPGQPVTITVPEAALEATAVRYQSYTDPGATMGRNAEAMFVDSVSGDLFVVEKAEHFLTEIGFPNGGNQERVWAIVYRVPQAKLFTGATQTAKIATYVRAQYDASADGITGGDISPDGRVIVLKNRDQVFYWFRSHGRSVVETFEAAPAAPCLMDPTVPGEAVTVLPDGSAFYFVREGTLTPVYRASIVGWAGPECEGSTATLVGTPGDDVLIGTPGDDVIVAFGGDDTIDGRGGDDVICAGAGDDVVVGGAGRDVVYGGRGEDVLRGGKAKDKLWGDFDGDVLRGGSGADVLRGGEHRDVLYGGGGSDLVSGGGGADEVVGNGSTDDLRGGKGGDALRGSAGNDVLSGGSGMDDCDGGAGVDSAKASCERLVAVP